MDQWAQGDDGGAEEAEVDLDNGEYGARKLVPGWVLGGRRRVESL